jgi:hypothetical protein
VSPNQPQLPLHLHRRSRRLQVASGELPHRLRLGVEFS